MSRTEHVNWCKQRALEFVNEGDLKNAFTSMCSDMTKHTETKQYADTLALLGTLLMQAGKLNTQAELK